jgi:SNF2 family DNA or RNA helicase
MKKIHLSNEPKTNPKFDAFPYQKEAFESIKDLEYAAVFHEQGLGKTKIAIDTLLYWLEKSSIDTVLIVTKKELFLNWKKEFSSHTYIKPAILTDEKKNNHFVFVSPARVIITNFEILQVEKKQFVLYLKTRNVAIIIDESAKLKNPKSKLTQTYFELSPLFKKRLILTGTPVANRPYDIWAQIFFLDHGKSLGNNFSDFKAQTDLSNKLAGNEELQETFEREYPVLYLKNQGLFM